MADADMGPAPNAAAAMAQNPKAPRVDGRRSASAEMPAKPTLMDFFHYRFGPCMHLLQSARHAVKGGLSEKMVLACLLHDIRRSALSGATTAIGVRNCSSPMSRRK